MQVLTVNFADLMASLNKTNLAIAKKNSEIAKPIENKVNIVDSSRHIIKEGTQTFIDNSVVV